MKSADEHCVKSLCCKMKQKGQNRDFSLKTSRHAADLSALKGFANGAPLK
jgi:hypothetical protein